MKSSLSNLTLKLKLNHESTAESKGILATVSEHKNHNFTIKYLDAQIQTDGNRLKVTFYKE